MIYVFDNSPLSALFKNYYRGVFRTLWQGFDDLVDAGQVLSTREVLREIEDSSIEALRTWAADHKDIFATPPQRKPHSLLVSTRCSIFNRILKPRSYSKAGTTQIRL